jgi:serine/threonine protein phosphatase PrpC
MAQHGAAGQRALSCYLVCAQAHAVHTQAAAAGAVRVKQPGAACTHTHTHPRVGSPAPSQPTHAPHTSAGLPPSCPLTAEPEVTTHTLCPEDEFLLVGCDGLWDVLPSQRAVEIARARWARLD